MHPGGCLLCNAVDALEHLRVLLVEHGGQIAAIVQHHVGIPGLAVLKDGLLDTPLIFLFCFAFPGKNRDASCSDGRCSVVLGREDVAGRPPHFCAQLYEGLNQHAGLDRHVDAAQYLCASKGLCVAVVFPQRHQSGHFALGDLQFSATPIGEVNVCDFVVGENALLNSSVHNLFS